MVKVPNSLRGGKQALRDLLSDSGVRWLLIVLIVILIPPIYLIVTMGSTGWALDGMFIIVVASAVAGFFVREKIAAVRTHAQRSAVELPLNDMSVQGTCAKCGQLNRALVDYTYRVGHETSSESSGTEEWRGSTIVRTTTTLTSYDLSPVPENTSICGDCIRDERARRVQEHTGDAAAGVIILAGTIVAFVLTLVITNGTSDAEREGLRWTFTIGLGLIQLLAFLVGLLVAVNSLKGANEWQAKSPQGVGDDLARAIVLERVKPRGFEVLWNPTEFSSVQASTRWHHLM